MIDDTRINVPPKVKICGLTRPEDVACAADLGASFLGFILAKNSARYVSPAAAGALSKPYKNRLPSVAVTVNASDDLLRSIMTDMAPDYIQCHGDEPPRELARIAKTYDVKTIKAVPISSDEDMKHSEIYSGVCEFILYDAKPPKNETIRGGHGLSFDWDILTRAPLPKLWALAGGLTPDNAREAIERTNAPILDLSSGLESAAGIKDAEKIARFMRAISA